VRPVEFPEMTITWAKDQPPYLPLPAYTSETETISCWRLSWRDRLRALFGGCLWLRQMNFGQPLQPQCPSFERPFVAHQGGKEQA
jgi:hypothetical protein